MNSGQTHRDIMAFFGYLAVLILSVAASYFVLFMLGAANWPVGVKATFIVGSTGIGLLVAAWRFLGDIKLARLAVLFAKLGRWLDRKANRNRFDRTGWRRFVAMHGHTWKPTLLAVLFAAVMTFGPDWWRRGDISNWLLAGAIFSAAVGLIIWLNYWSSPEDGGAADDRYHRSTVFLWVIMVAVIVAPIIIADPAGRSTEHILYRHLWQFIAVILLGLLIFAAFLARKLFKECRGEIPLELEGEGGLPRDEIDPMFIRDDEDVLRNLRIDWKRFARNLIKAPIHHSLEILLLLSFPVLLVSDNATMVQWAFYIGVTAWVLYALGEMHERLGHLLNSLRRMFFLGGQLVVSLIVILLAAGRLFDNSYIATLVEGQGWFWFSNITLLGYILSSYTVFWFYEYWTNRFLNDQIIAMVKGSEKTPGRVVITDGTRTLQVHGGSRFANVHSDLVHRTYGRMKLLDRLLGGKKSGSEWGERKIVLKHLIVFYFTSLNILLVIPLAVAAYAYNSLPQRPEIQASVEAADDNRLFDLKRSALTGSNEADSCGNHVIVLAASGGGTRAALYTYSVLRGLRQIELAKGCPALKRVLLVSGVSGGSAALAYFKINRETLLRDMPGADPDNSWRKFRKTMAAPFIQDVLLGASEMRLLYGCGRNLDKEGRKRFTEGLRLSSLLRESFDRRLGSRTIFGDGCAAVTTEPGDDAAIAGDKDYRDRLGLENEKGIGFIFNTTLSGRFPIRDRTGRENCPGEAGNKTAATGGCTWPISRIESMIDPPGTSSFGKGGRLVFTNLSDAGALFASSGKKSNGGGNGFLNYLVIDDPRAPLATAAALSANFPPVVPNAAVDRGNLARYWVTDGGAADNRGLVSLLHVLQNAIEQRASSEPLPTLHIVVADASASDLAFTQNRGVGSALGAAERFASQIIADKLQKIGESYDKPGHCYFHNLTMPLVLRSNGGIGTHWMLPDEIVLRPPFGTGAGTTRPDSGGSPGKVRPCIDIDADSRDLEPTGVNKAAAVFMPFDGANPCGGDRDDAGWIKTIGHFLYDRLSHFLSLTAPGCEIGRGEIFTLFDTLHNVNSDKKTATKKPNVLKWLCAEPPVGLRHEDSWRHLVVALGDPAASPGYCPAP